MKFFRKLREKSIKNRKEHSEKSKQKKSKKKSSKKRGNLPDSESEIFVVELNKNYENAMDLENKNINALNDRNRKNERKGKDLKDDVKNVKNSQKNAKELKVTSRNSSLSEDNVNYNAMTNALQLKNNNNETDKINSPKSESSINNQKTLSKTVFDPQNDRIKPKPYPTTKVTKDIETRLNVDLDDIPGTINKSYEVVKDCFLRAKKGEIRAIIIFFTCISISLAFLNVLEPLLRNVSACVYPVYMSYKAINESDSERAKKWLVFWMVYGTIQIFEPIFYSFLKYFPYYSMARLSVLIWLYHDSTNGAEVIFKFMKPVLGKHEESIDKKLKSAAGFFPFIRG